MGRRLREDSHEGSSARSLESSPDPIRHLDMNRLLHLAGELRGKTDGVWQEICRAVDEITHHRALLVLPLSPADPLTADMQRWFPVPVRFGGQIHGYLAVRPSSGRAWAPSIAPEEAQFLASLCGFVLHTLEHAALITGLSRNLAATTVETLTRSEQNVLTWMARGEDDRAIAIRLCISVGTVRKHKEHIYGKLHAHSSVTAILTAHRAGILQYIPTSHDR